MRRWAVIVWAGLLACSACSDNGGDRKDLGVPTGPEDTADRCQDGKDNDGDGKTDCADSECAAFLFCSGDGGLKDGPRSDGQRFDGPRPGDGPEVLPDVKIPLPKCDQGCALNEVCLDNNCVPVGPARSCGSSEYPSGLPSSGVLYVNGSFSGTSTGSQSQPYKSIGQALAVINSWAPDAGVGPSHIAVASGTYKEDLTIQRSVTLACRCPEGGDAVTLVGKIVASGPPPAGDAGAATFGGSEAKAVVIDGCTIQEKDFSGAPATCAGGEDPRGISANSGGAQLNLLVRHSIVRGFCVGLYYSAPSTSDSTLCVSHSRFVTNGRGLEVMEAHGLLYNPHSWPTGDCQGVDQAVSVELTDVTQNVTGVITAGGARMVALQGNLIRGSTSGSGTGWDGMGVYLGNAVSARVTGNVIRNNAALGLGVINSTATALADIAVSANHFEANHVAGIQFVALQTDQPVSIQANVVKGTLSNAGQFGDGIVLTLGQSGTSYDVTIQKNTVESSARHGILYDGVGGSVTQNTITASGKYGVVLQQSTATVGANNFTGNLAGNQVSYPSKVDPVSNLPGPMP